MTGPRPLRIGVITDGDELRLFDAELIRRIQAAGIAQIAVVIQQELPRKSLVRKVWRALKRGTLLRTLAFRAVTWFERRIVGFAKPGIGELFATVPIDRVCDAERLRIRPLVSASGLVHRLAAADVETIKSRKLDLILRATSAILRGDVLHSASGGVISFHHGDNRDNRGGPPAFWEVYERRDYTGFIVQRLSEELDGGEVLLRGELATRASYLLNQHHLFKCSITSMVDLLARMRREREVPPGPGAEAVSWYSNSLYTTPSVAESLAYFLAFFWRVVLTNAVRKLFAGYEVWELRLLRGDWRNLVLWKAKALSPPRGRFWADPFVVRRSNDVVIFFEEFEFRRGKAHIAALVGDGRNPFRYAGPVVEAPHHLSFPYVFRHSGEYYMCPESCESGAIQLWRCVSWPLKWELCKTILADVSAADTMIFERDGRWWLFTNLDRDGTGDHCRELHIYHADSPLSDCWTPLDANPVVTGASRARNAGLLSDHGRLYRLAQSQGFNRYGRSLKLFEIYELSPSGYGERLISELSPNPRLRASGIHHLSACEDTVVFDAIRPRYFWSGARSA